MTSGSGPLFLGPDVAGWQTVAMVAQPTRPEDPKEEGGQGEDFGKSSPVGLLVLLLFFIAVAFLVRSMTKHLKKVPASFDEPSEPKPDADPDAKPADSVDSVEEKK
jgi:hypothetical protein